MSVPEESKNVLQTSIESLKKTISNVRFTPPSFTLRKLENLKKTLSVEIRKLDDYQKNPKLYGKSTNPSAKPSANPSAKPSSTTPSTTKGSA